jgi:thiol-disulfide isomerase/thioredoxin
MSMKDGNRTGLLSRRATIAGMGLIVSTTRTVSSLSRVPKFAGYLGDFFPFDSVVTFPSVVFQDASGRYTRLRDMTGRVLLLNFWATWCLPCVEEMPDLDRLQARFATQPFTVLALCEDVSGLSAAEGFFRAHRLQHLGVYVDPQGQARRDCSVPAIPASFLIDRQGRPRGILPGAAPWDSPAAHALIEYYLAGN